MPTSKMIQKAGKLSFLLVCLFLCTACKKEKAVFEAGETPIAIEETHATEAEKVKEIEVTESLPKKALVNINTADMNQLMTLPGIGKVRAAAIVEYRDSHGEFEKIEDIMNVKGIKTGIFSKLNSFITVE